jgi:hypothetical protein
MFSLTDRPDHRNEDPNHWVYDCPHCGAENVALPVEYKGIEQPVIFRTKTMSRVTDFVACENPQCRAYRVSSPYLEAKEARKDYKPASDICPECSEPRDKAVTPVKR